MNLVKVCEIENVTIKYFCNKQAYLGEALFKIDDEGYEVAPIKYAPVGAILAGINLNNVVKAKKGVPFQLYFSTIEQSKHNLPRNAMPTGSKIEVLQRGNIIISLPPLEIPCGQPLYINQDGQITWKYSIYKVGKTISSQDRDGYIKALIKINEV